MSAAEKPSVAPAGRPGNLMSESRIVRAPPTGNKLADFVSNMQQIARIANGISLQAGLIDATMPVDEVIGELLHMGLMTPNQLMAVSPDVVKQLMSEMKATPEKLVESKSISDIEDFFLEIASAMKADIDMNAFKNLAGKKEYETHLDNAIKSKLDVNDIQTYHKDAIGLYDLLEKVKNMKSDVDKTLVTYEIGTLMSILRRFGSIEKAVTDTKFQDLISFVTSLKLMREKSAFVDLLGEEEQVRKAQGISITTSSSRFANVTANFQVFEELSNSFGKHQEVLKKLHSFVETRRSGRQLEAQYTGGFPDGVKDLENLSVDIDDKWFQQNAGGQKMSGDLKKGLLPLVGFKADVRSVENAWQLAETKIGSVEAVVGQQARIASQATNVKSISTKMVALLSCSQQFPNNIVANQQAIAAKQKAPIWTSFLNRANDGPGSIIRIGKPIELIRELNRRIDLVDDFQYFGRLSDFSMLRKAMNVSGLSTVQEMEAVIPNVVRKLKAMPEVQEKTALVKKYVEVLDATVQLSQVFSTNALQIKNATLSIDAYHSDVKNSNFGDWRDCAKGSLGSDGEVVVTMIEGIRKLREMGKKKEISDAEGSLVAFLNSAHLLKPAQSSAQRLKNEKTLESKTMSLLKKDVSSRLGLAAQGLKKIQKADENRERLDFLMGNIAFIDSAAESYKSRLTAEEYSSLRSLNTLRSFLIVMFRDIDEFKPSIDKLVGTDLKSNKPALDAAAKIRSVKVDVEKLKKAVESLAKLASLNRQMMILLNNFVQVDQQQLTNISASLDALGELDLDFSRYKMGGASGAIDDLDAFFHSSPQPLPVTEKEVTLNSEKDSWPILLIVGVISLVALLIGLIVGAVFLIRKLKKEKLKKKNGAEEKDLRPQTGTKRNEPKSPKSPVRKGSASAESTIGGSLSAEQSKSPNAKSPIAVSPGARKEKPLSIVENTPSKGLQKDTNESLNTKEYIMPMMQSDNSKHDEKKMVDQNEDIAGSEEQKEENRARNPMDISEKVELVSLVAVDEMAEKMEDSDEFELTNLEQFEKFERAIFAGYAFNNYSEIVEPWKKMTIECY